VNVREVPGLEFGPTQIVAFAPVVPVIEAFAIRYGLELSRVRDDTDRINPHVCYFASWRVDVAAHSVAGGRCWISLCARDPSQLGAEFRIYASGRCQREWDYSIEEGMERLESILEQAWFIAARTEDNLDPGAA
jgi:hypothetical protein